MVNWRCVPPTEMVFTPDVMVGAEPQPLLSAATVSDRAASPRIKELTRRMFVCLEQENECKIAVYCKVQKLRVSLRKEHCEYIYPPAVVVQRLNAVKRVTG
jgi:hypothetical protein